VIRLVSKRWLLALVALALSGFGSFASVTAQTAPVTLIVWDPFTGSAGDAAQKIYDRFTAAHPEIAIERKVLAGDDLAPSALRTALASGLGPDVLAFAVNPESIRILTTDPVLDPLNELPVTSNWLDRLPDTAERWLRQDGSRDGRPTARLLHSGAGEGLRAARVRQRPRVALFAPVHDGAQQSDRPSLDGLAPL
jgi:ABC-type glycerol-3-phosphate transport system substrate-binding protein